MEENTIINPLTHRKIKKHGKVYKDLINKGIIPSDLPDVQKVRNPLSGRLIAKGSTLHRELLENQKISKQAPVEKKVKAFQPPKDYHVPQTFQDFPIDRQDVSWGSKKPSSVGERRFIHENCGDSCFLIPETNKFPICNKTLPCTYNCRGIKAASSRAGEFKYTKVLETSKKLSSEFGCYKHKK